MAELRYDAGISIRLYKFLWIIPMANLILPLRAVALQLLFLLVAVAIEAFVLRQRLGMTPRGSARYALALNLFSSVLGWLLVFSVQPLLPEALQTELVSLTLFGQFYSSWALESLLPIFAMSALAVLLGTFLAESFCMNFLLLIWASVAPSKHRNISEVQVNRNLRYSTSQTTKVRRDALLIGNALSFGAVLLLVVVLSQTQLPL
jgi:hypothetical protein